MTFPHYFHIFGHAIHPHLVMEIIGYSGGFQLYVATRKRWPRAAIGVEQNLWIIVGAIFGALIGSKLLAWTESGPYYWSLRHDPAAWLGGKTIVGGLLGGWIGVEIAKKVQGVRHSTGDAFVFPLIFGMAVGRIGCFLTGFDDHTHGVPTSLPWGIDMGGPGHFRRHPTQLYDIIFLATLALLLALRMRRPFRNGHIFSLFLLGYALWRFSVEFIKARFVFLFDRSLPFPNWRLTMHFTDEAHTFGGLSAIQFACALAAIWLIWKIAVQEKNKSATG